MRRTVGDLPEEHRIVTGPPASRSIGRRPSHRHCIASTASPPALPSSPPSASFPPLPVASPSPDQSSPPPNPASHRRKMGAFLADSRGQRRRGGDSHGTARLRGGESVARRGGGEGSSPHDAGVRHGDGAPGEEHELGAGARGGERGERDVLSRYGLDCGVCLKTIKLVFAKCQPRQLFLDGVSMW